MSDVSQTDAPAAGQLPGDSVDQLATKALSLVARRQRQANPGIMEKFVLWLQSSVATGRPSDGLATVRRMVEAGIAPEDIADLYIPAAARQLGEMWCEDEVSFATVTIGVARLQGLLRDLEDIAGMARMDEPGGASLLVVVPAGVYHTLGAMVLTGQLRRRGHAVRLLLGSEPEAVAVAVRQARFDAVLISAAEGVSIESIRSIVQAVKSATGDAPSVVIGGAILDAAATEGRDIKALTGVDHATSDPNEALDYCGFTAELRVGTLSRHGS